MRALRWLMWAVMAVVAWYFLGKGRIAVSEHLGLLLGVLACVAGIVVLGWRGRSGGWNGSGSRARALRIFVWMGLVVVLLFWLGLATRAPVHEMVWAWERTFDPPPAREDGEETAQEQTTGHMDWNEGSRRALPRHTNIKPGRKPEVFVRMEDRPTAEKMSKGPIYVSSIGYDRYEDSAWHIAAESPGDRTADASGIITLNKDAGGEGLWHTIVMSADAKRRSPLVSLQGLAQLDGLKSVERWSSCLYLLPQLEEPGKGYRYRALSRPMELKDIPEADPAETVGNPDPSWLRMPQDALGKRISELVASVATGASPAENARRIQSHLRGNYRYTLATANPRNLDPLENFLFDEKSGHCEYFATAGALMARAAGIPSRVMYGWAGGTWYEYADWFVFRADEAHVWVELWLGDRGWVVMDPTPPDALGAQQHRVTKEQLPVLPGVVMEDALPAEEVESAPVIPWVVSALLAVLAVAVLLRTSARAVNADDKRIIPEPWRERATLHYLEEWRKAAKLPLPRRSRASTLRQQVRAVNPAPEFADELLAYHYRVRYEGQPRDRARERKLMRRIRAWAADSKE